MKQKEKIEMFKQFLKDNDCYKKFKKELMREKKIKINIFLKYNIHDMESFIIYAFSYSATKDGTYYWRRINTKWKELLNATR